MSLTDDREPRPDTANLSGTKTRSKNATRYTIAAVLCVLVVGGLLWFGLSSNIVYYRTATEAVTQRSSVGSERFRLAGAVVPGTIRALPNGVAFDVTDGVTTVAVQHRGDPPQLFADGAPVLRQAALVHV